MEAKKPNGKCGNKKISLLLVLRALEHFSDKNHPIKQVDLAKLVNDVGAEHNLDVWCDRKTVGRHLKLLTAVGYDVRKINGKGVYMQSENFNFPECRILKEVVKDTQKLTEEKKKQILCKLDRQQQLLAVNGDFLAGPLRKKN